MKSIDLKEFFLQKEKAILKSKNFSIYFIHDFEKDLEPVCVDVDLIAATFSFLSNFIEKFSFKKDKMQKESIKVSIRMLGIEELEAYTVARNIGEKTEKFILCSFSSENFFETTLALPNSYEEFWKTASPWRDISFEELMWGEPYSFLSDFSSFPLKGEKVFPFLQEILRKHEGFIVLGKEEKERRNFTLGFPVLSVKDEIELSLRHRIQSALETRKDFFLLFLSLKDRKVKEADWEISKMIRKQDAVFSILQQKEYMILMEDCSEKEVIDIAMRIKENLAEELSYAIANFPLHGRTAQELLDKIYG